MWMHDFSIERCAWTFPFSWFFFVYWIDYFILIFYFINKSLYYVLWIFGVFSECSEFNNLNVWNVSISGTPYMMTRWCIRIVTDLNSRFVCIHHSLNSCNSWASQKHYEQKQNKTIFFAYILLTECNQCDYRSSILRNDTSIQMRTFNNQSEWFDIIRQARVCDNDDDDDNNNHHNNNNKTVLTTLLKSSSAIWTNKYRHLGIGARCTLPYVSTHNKKIVLLM